MCKVKIISVRDFFELPSNSLSADDELKIQTEDFIMNDIILNAEIVSVRSIPGISLIKAQSGSGRVLVRFLPNTENVVMLQMVIKKNDITKPVKKTLFNEGSSIKEKNFLKQ